MNIRIVCFLFLIGANASAGESLAEKLIELRAEVQTVADQLDAEKKFLNSSVQSLTIEKGELESRKKLLSLQNKEMRKTIAQKKKIAGGQEIESLKGYSGVVTEGFEGLLEYYSKAIPFKVSNRVAKVQKIMSKFEKQEITVSEYFEKYWSLLQSEIRLSDNVEIQNDNIEIEGKEYQVKVLKLGMYQMYFKTYDGQVGYAQNQDKKWAFHFFKNSKLESGVNLLFAAKEKVIKGGNYMLPIVNNTVDGKVVYNTKDEEVKNVF